MEKLIFEAHRGVATEFPENTLPAFQAAADQGYGMIELDPEITSDGRFVLHHDSTVNRRCDRLDGAVPETPIQISELTLAEARRYELTGAADSRTAVTFFWNEMMARHLYATGSLSDKEHFFPPEDFRRHITGVTGESCCTYNMLRLARHLYAWQPSAAVMDYYERALYNHILGAQNPETGMVISPPLSRAMCRR